MADAKQPIRSQKSPTESPKTIDLREGARGDDRGRRADNPTEIPAKGWKDVAKRVMAKAKQDNLTLVAGGIAFFSLLSFPPALVVIVSIYGLVASPDDVSRHVANLSSAMPDDARRLITDQLTQVVSANRAGLGVSLIIGIVIALWGASTAMKHLMVALTLANNEDERRSYLALRLRAALLTLAGIVFVIVTILLLTVAPSWVETNVNSTLGLAVSILRWPALMLAMLVGLAFVYRYAPDRDEPKWRWVSWGAGLATVLWVIASIAFTVYASHFGSYNKTYGSMAAVVITMLWLYLTALCVLLGAVVNAELEHQTMKDTTKGHPEPMGERDAYVADTVGAAST